MDLWTLFEKATAGLPASRTKDIKTAVRVLTQALGHDDPRNCPPEAYNLPLPQIRRLVEAQLTSKGAHTIRNTKQNLGALFRLAESHKLLERPVAIAKRHFLTRSLPRRSNGSCTKI